MIILINICSLLLLRLIYGQTQGLSESAGWFRLKERPEICIINQPKHFEGDIKGSPLCFDNPQTLFALPFMSFFLNAILFTDSNQLYWHYFLNVKL